MLDQQAAKVALTEQLERLRARAERIDDHQHNRDRDVPKDSEELAAFRDNDEVVDALEGATRRDIASIEAALRRMDAGTWTTCIRCDGAIEPARLEALATVTLCRSCAAETEADAD